MRVLIAIAELRTGGAERVVVTLAHGLTAAGATVGVAGARGELDPEFAPAERFAFTDRGRSPLGLAAGALAVARGVRALRADVVHAHNVRASAFAQAGARLGRPAHPPPVLSTFHGVDPDEDGRAARILARSAAITCVSGDLAARLRSTGAALPPLSVVPNAVSPAPEVTPAERAALAAELGLTGEPVIAAICRLVPAKALQRLLEALPRVREAVPGTRLVVVGDGPDRASLEALAAQLGLAGSVIFTGLRPDARRILALAQVLAVSSASEGQPLAVLEALAAGVPVVSTPVSGMRDLLGTGAGTVVDRPGDLAEALIAVLRDPEGRARMGTIGRALVAERHSAAAMVAAYRALYEGV